MSADVLLRNKHHLQTLIGAGRVELLVASVPSIDAIVLKGVYHKTGCAISGGVDMS